MNGFTMSDETKKNITKIRQRYQAVPKESAIVPRAVLEWGSTRFLAGYRIQQRAEARRSCLSETASAFLSQRGMTHSEFDWSLKYHIGFGSIGTLPSEQAYIGDQNY